MSFKLNMYLAIAVIFLLGKIEFSEGIIGGTGAENGEFPFMVSLRNETNKHYCGGSLITRRHILTAAHCLFTDPSVLFYNYDQAELYEASAIKAVVGTIYNDLFHGQVYRASKLIPHQRYNFTIPYTIFHDIGIVKLTEEVTQEQVIPIPLPTAPATHARLGTVIGWGIDSRHHIPGMSKVAHVLQKVYMEIMKPKNCLNLLVDQLPDLVFTELAFTQALFAQTAFCGFNEHANVCYRDSGSPLIQDGKIAGVVIFGNACKEGSPDTFTSVHVYLDFIHAVIDTGCITETNTDANNHTDL